MQPCEFVNLSFGNIATDDFEKIYRNMRSHFDRPRADWLCEKYSGRILQLYKDRRLESLPLDPLLSEEVYATWDRGGETEFYQTIEKKMVP